VVEERLPAIDPAQLDADVGRAEDLFRAVVDATGALAWLWVGRNYERTWGRAREELAVAPESWLQAVHPDDRPRLSAAVGDLARTGRFMDSCRLVHADGSVRWVRMCQALARDAAGSPTHIAALVDDITEQRTAEQRLSVQHIVTRLLAPGIAASTNGRLLK
jgi:PAS domain S-box-containing protein